MNRQEIKELIDGVEKLQKPFLRLCFTIHLIHKDHLRRLLCFSVDNEIIQNLSPKFELVNIRAEALHFDFILMNIKKGNFPHNCFSIWQREAGKP